MTQTIEMMRTQIQKTVSLRKVEVQAIGEKGAVISYNALATRPPATPDDKRDVEFDALCCSVWRLEGDKWMLAFHQQTMAD